MKLGVISNVWLYAGQQSIMGCIENVARFGFRFFSLGNYHASLLLSLPEEKRELKHRLESLGLGVSSVCAVPPGNLASPDEKEVASCWCHLQAIMDLASFLECKLVQCHPGQRTQGIPYERTWCNAVAFMDRCCNYAEKGGLHITIEAEPHPYFLVNDLRSTQRMLLAGNSPRLMVTLDLGHLGLTRQNPQDLAPFTDRIAEIHITDNDGLMHANKIIGTGSTPLLEYLETLQGMDLETQANQRDFDLVASLELGVPGEDISDPDLWIRCSLKHLRKVVPFLELS